MRAIRLFLLFLLAIVLIFIALANRDLITVSLVPGGLAPAFGGQWSMTMPVFLALFLAMIFGMVVGLVWEWLREAGHRAEARARTREIERLSRELDTLRRGRADAAAPARTPEDEVLAILAEAEAKPGTSRPAPSRPAPPLSGAGLPASR